MNLETLRCLTDGLNNPTYGVNAQLLALPLDGSDTRPTPVALITDESRNFDAALKLIPDTLPAIYVLLASSTLDVFEMNGSSESDISLMIRYLVEDSDSAGAIADTHYTLRAVEKALVAFNSNANASDRVRNGVQLYAMKEVIRDTVTRFSEDKVITAGVQVTFHARDTNS